MAMLTKLHIVYVYFLGTKTGLNDKVMTKYVDLKVLNIYLLALYRKLLVTIAAVGRILSP